MKIITGLLSMVAGAIVFNTASAVPRYSTSVPQVGDSPNAVTTQQGDSKMNNERGGVEKEIMVDALKGCRDGATIGIVSGSLRGGIAGGAAGGLPGAAAGAAAGAATGAAAGCVNGMITGVAKGATVRTIKEIQATNNNADGKQKSASSMSSMPTSNEVLQIPNAPVLQRGKQESQSCNVPQTYVTCAYTRPVDAPVVGKVAEAALGDRGVHWQIVIYNGKTGKQIASYGKTTKPIVDGSSVAGFVAGGVVGAGVGALEGVTYGQGIITLDDPTKNPEYAVYRQEPVWCIESAEISVLKPGYYEALDTDCREYAERVKDDLLHNKGGREISAPQYTILSMTCNKDEIDARDRKRTAESFNPNDKAQHPDFDSHNCGDQSGKATVKDEPLDSCKTTDVAVVERKKDTLQVGVRGWCHCWDKTPPYSGCLKEVGIANMRDVAELVNAMAEISQTYDGAYRYTICDQCGKCFTIAKVGKKWSDTGDEIVDTTIFNKYKEKAGRSIPYHHFEDMLAKARDKLLIIPDGQIVISGICSCKYSDPMRVGVQIPFGEYYVCVFCGRVRLPDDTGSIPLGPTEWERRMGRSGKPFSGFEK